jgi:hypothetical protein
MGSAYHAMNYSECIKAANSNLYNAGRYLESGDAVNWVPDALSTALLWAMEAWLKFNRHEIGHGRGWADTRRAF